MAHVMRILDANANRAREALRVMEESARFILDHQELTRQIKQLRHDLASALGPLSGLESSRDTPGDVGTAVKTTAELTRASVGDVTIAAGKRLSEALRALEEFGKTIDGQMARQIEALRYRGYHIEQQLNHAMGSGRARQWRLCVLISESLCPAGDWLSVARAAMAGGADCLQLREKNLDAGLLLERARQLVALARPMGVSVMINDRPDVALLSGADGVHLGQTDLPCREARKLVGRQLLIGVSTSCLKQACQARDDGADYCGVGPMFPTTTKHKDVIAGPAYLQQYVQWGQLPHLAIGGIDSANVSQLVSAGVRGMAVSSAVCGAKDPQAAAGQLLAAVMQG